MTSPEQTQMLTGIVFRITAVEDGRARGVLTWESKGLRSGAASGPYGRGELPKGLYHVERSGLLDKDSAGFCDSLNRCWFQFIAPQFSTPRNELGIHPDGGKAGTKGCIGILDSDTSAWLSAFKAIPKEERVEVHVV